MLMEGTIMDNRRISGNGLDTYCRLEGVDQLYLAVEKYKKVKEKNTGSPRKKLTILKLF